MHDDQKNTYSSNKYKKMKLIKLLLTAAFFFILYPVYAQIGSSFRPCICADKPPEICQEILKLEKEKISKTKKLNWNQRFSIACNMSHTTYSRSPIEDFEKNARGIAVQYHFLGIRISNGSWRGNPFFGLNLFMDGTLMNSKLYRASFGLGLELQFLYIFRAAVGLCLF